MSQAASTFLDKLAAHPALQEELQHLPGNTSAQEIVAVASRHGLTLSPDEVSAFLSSDAELSDADLESVNGGVLGQDLRNLTNKVNNDIDTLRNKYPGMLPPAKKP